MRRGPSVLVLVLWVLLGAAPVRAEIGFLFETPGAGSALREDLLAASLLREVRVEGVTDPQELLAAAQADYARLLAALYARARFGGTIRILLDGREAAGIPPLAPPRRIGLIRIRVETGPIYRFARAEIRPLAPDTALPGAFRAGAPASTGAVREVAEAAIDGWRAQGHAKVTIASQRITADHRARTVVAVLAVDPGPVLSFGPVVVAGNRDVRADRIRAIAGLREGRRFEPAETERALDRLRRSGAFSSVTIEEAAEPGPGDTLPLTIAVAEATPRRFGFGAEYSTVEGARLSGFWMHRNFLGGAERLRFDGAVAGITGETGGIDLSFGARFERPATPGTDVDFFAEFGLERLDEPDFASDSAEATVGLTRYASDTLTLTSGVGLRFSEVTDDFGTEDFRLVTLPLGAVRDRRDDPLDAGHGHYLDLAITPFAGSSAGLRTTLDARAYRSAGRLTFAGRMQAGALVGPALLDSPPFYRFHSGGGGTVRGQDYQSLGLDIGGNRTGGRSFLGLSGEIRADVTGDIELVGFLDWGMVGAGEFPDFASDSHAGAGLGLRYKTGIGPIRLDIATPVAGDTPASDVYLYIGIGQAF